MTYPNARTSFKTERVGERRPFKRKPAPKWSHQKELDELRGKKIVMAYQDNTVVEAILLEADQFTLKVDNLLLRANSLQSVMTVFKSDLSSFRAAE